MSRLKDLGGLYGLYRIGQSGSFGKEIETMALPPKGYNHARIPAVFSAAQYTPLRMLLISRLLGQAGTEVDNYFVEERSRSLLAGLAHESEVEDLP